MVLFFWVFFEAIIFLQEDFDELEDVDMLYNTLSLDMVDALEDLVSIVPPGLVKLTRLKSQGMRTLQSFKLVTSFQRYVHRRKAEHVLKYPDARVISLGTGDTTEPIPKVITTVMAKLLLHEIRNQLRIIHRNITNRKL
ncbi:putative LL-diaminopimelate aminotransferase [Helianthus anomalus]